MGAVARMAATMDRRGPDGWGVWAQGRLALAHRRLKVIDLSERAAQPMVDPDLGLAIVFNGCIYNYPELRRQLRAEGHRFFSTGDTEVVLKAYRQWGTDFVDHLQGMFACAIVELAGGRLVLARDRLGIKPLYLAETPGALRFASTLPALLAGGGIDTTVDRVALHHYLSFHSVVPPPRTILTGVTKLAPATVVVVEPDGTRRHHRYWEPLHERRGDHAAMTGGDWEDAVAAALRLAVERRLVADVAVGVLLSGASTPASSWVCWPKPASTAWLRSVWDSKTPAGERATSSPTAMWWPGPSPPSTTSCASAPTGCWPPSTERWRP